MTPDRLPWEIVETLPFTDGETIGEWERRVESSTQEGERVVALVGCALSHYWASPLGESDDTGTASAGRRRDDIDLAVGLARETGDADLVATALLGRLYATWGPPDLAARRPVLDELTQLRSTVVDQELRVRIVEWQVLDAFDRGDLDRARHEIDEFLHEAEGMDSKLFGRREVLWRANIEMLEGDLDEAVRLNEEAIASTADLAGSPFSFQNVAITIAIARYLRRSLSDVVDAIRSIRASSPRVEVNWDVGLTFALSEIGEFDEARMRFEALAQDRFSAVPRDLNWLVSMHLLGLIAVTLDDRDRAAELLEHLRDHAAVDATHGSGYASYGPVGRVVGLLACCVGSDELAESWFEFVLTSRSAGPWTALTRMDRAVSRGARDPAGALADAQQAEPELRRFGLDVRADAARMFAAGLRLDGHGEPTAQNRDGVWTLTHPSGRVELRDGVGVRYLCRLLRHPGQSVDVVDLDERIDRSVPRGSAVEAALDPEARSAYHRRLEQLDAMVTLSDREDRERNDLRRELAGGRHATASKEIEKARVRVTTAIRRTLATIADATPALGEHLMDSIETGRRCSYQPVSGIAWRVED